MLVQTERVLPDALVRNAVALGKDGQRDFTASAFQDNVAGTAARRHLTHQLQLELQIAIVGGALIAQEAIGRLEVDVFVALSCGANAATVLIVFDVHVAAIQIDSGPALLVLVEVGGDRDNGVARRRLTLGGVAIAEAGRAAKAIVLIQIEEARFASVK